MPFAFDPEFSPRLESLSFFEKRAKAFFQFMTLFDGSFIKVMKRQHIGNAIDFYVIKGQTQSLRATVHLREYNNKLKLAPFYGHFYDYYSLLNKNPTIINFEAKDTEELFVKVVSCFAPQIKYS